MHIDSNSRSRLVRKNRPEYRITRDPAADSMRSCLSFAVSHEHMNNQSARISRRPATPADLDLFRHVEENLYTAVVSDFLGELGCRNQATRVDLEIPVGSESKAGEVVIGSGLSDPKPHAVWMVKTVQCILNLAHAATVESALGCPVGKATLLMLYRTQDV